MKKTTLAHTGIPLLILLVGLVSYSNSLHGSFHYDDITSIVQNPGIRSLSPMRVWTENNPFRFAGFYSFALNYRLSGLDDVRGWHAVNIGLHLLCSALLGLLAGKLSGERGYGVGVMTGVLFAAHPLCSEPVNYIQARHVLLYSVAALWGVISAREWFEATSRARRVAAAAGVLGAIALGGLSKEVGLFYVPAGIMIYLMVFGHHRLSGSARVRWCIAIAAVTAGILCLVWYKGFWGMVFSRNVHPVLGETSFSTRVVTEGRVFWEIARMAVPDASLLNVDHRVALANSQTWWELAGCAAPLAGIAGLVAAGLWMRTWAPYPAFMLLWAVMGYIPYLPGGRTAELLVEYKAYLSIMGIAGFAGWMLGLMGRAVGAMAGARWGKAAAWGLCGLLAAHCISETRERNRLWADDLTLWGDAIKKGPSNLKRANAYVAAARYGQMLQGDPRNADAWNNRGAAYAEAGDYSQALSDFNRALNFAPRHAGIYTNRGIAYQKMGDCDRAIADFDEALHLDPRHAEAYNNRGVAYHSRGEYANAINDFTKAIEIDPERAAVYNNRGSVYGVMGDYDRAIADFNAALAIDPRYAEAYRNRGITYSQKGDTEQAREDFAKARDVASIPEEKAR
ncbi:MAG: tetratricopeptide repeat protein [Candidatus Aureabacteria bacterium]|nr:tetratricopeptide repeat protein [Candidatus Auribacterota bacterium]